ncbi:hypothetical protein BV25DRAFT_1842425 [Artomyces pyxidatus]|uniref:Uncharacterized protein n=1 Tax=Artomyces pyxidatus TaxID=48021 RepID=A0ACB8SJ19_9AGAM|nr:hypothetical protein BV25DRAFT_1842425 [Artomyces pyxidatus]
MLSQGFEIEDFVSIADRKNPIMTYGTKLFKGQGPMAFAIQRLHRFLRQAYSRRGNISSALYDRFDKMLLKAERNSMTKNWNTNSPAFMKMAAHAVKQREENGLTYLAVSAKDHILQERILTHLNDTKKKQELFGGLQDAIASMRDL